MIKTKQFGEYRDVGNPRTVAKVYDAQGVDELIIAAVAEECFIPLTVGGGIRTLEQAREMLAHGADKVAINTAAIEHPKFITEIANKFGNSTVVVSIDYKKNTEGKNEVFTHRGTEPTGLDPVEWAKEAESLGAGEILLTCIDREGMMNGYDLEVLKQVTSAVTIPVTASGGVGTIQDLVDGIVEGGASAVSAASIFHFTDQSIFKAHSHMKEKGLSVRKKA
jgi:cyclase